jgi:hypothetical protein
MITITHNTVNYIHDRGMCNHASLLLHMAVTCVHASCLLLYDIALCIG